MNQRVTRSDRETAWCPALPARRFRRSAAAGLLAIFATVVLALPVHATDTEKHRLVIFGFELQDTSHEGELHGERADEAARLKLLDGELKKLIEATGRYTQVDVSSAAAEISERRPLRNCNGCDVDIAKRFGATRSILGVVYKVSNLILEIHLYVRDTSSGKVINHLHANIRGNTDRSWLHGLRWLIRNRLNRSE